VLPIAFASSRTKLRHASSRDSASEKLNAGSIASSPAPRRSACSDPNGPVAFGESADRPKGGGAAPKLTVEEKAVLASWVQPEPDIAEDGVARWRLCDLRDRILQ
jgi:hypothetical protein